MRIHRDAGPGFALLALFPLLLGLGACGGGGGGGGAAGIPVETGFRVLSIDPADGALYVDLHAEIRAAFSEPIFLGKISESNFTLSETATHRRVPATVELEGGSLRAVLRPGEQFLLNTNYEVRIGSDVGSIGGEVLKATFVSHFTTAVTQNPPTPPPPPSPRQGSFRAVGEMSTGRSSHTATRLTNGTVLVAGGFSISTALTGTAEIYYPNSEEFGDASENLAAARGFHAAIRLSDGRVLVTGGVAGSGLAETDTAELYDPSDGSFTSAGTMKKARAFHTMTLLKDGRVLIAGGTVPGPSGAFSSKTAEIYAPSSGTFTSLPDMAVYRASHTATLLTSGKVLIAGGNGTDARCEIFDPSFDTFTTLGDQMDEPRRGHTATRLSNGNVLLTGGDGAAARFAEIFDDRVQNFSPTAYYPIQERKDHTASWTTDGFLLLGGGSRLVGGTTTFFNNSTELFRPTDSRFLTTSPALGVARTRHRATVLPDGRILFTGGANLDYRFPELKTAEVYETD